MKKKLHKNFTISHFLFTALICCFFSTNSFAVSDVALLCRPEINDPCNEKNICEAQNSCPCKFSRGTTLYTLGDGSKFCLPSSYDERLAEECIIKNFPAKGFGFGKVYQSYDRGMQGPYGFIFYKKFGLANQVKVKWIENGNKYENSFSYTENSNEVQMHLFGSINRKTLENRGVSCEISSENEIESVINNFYSATKRGNKF